MRLAPTIDDLYPALQHLSKAADRKQCSAKDRIALETTLEEVFANIVNHSSADEITFEVEERANAIVLRFADNGFPFNPLLSEDPDTNLPAEDRDIGGLGIFMVKKMTDEQIYEFQDGWNRLTIIKYLL